MIHARNVAIILVLALIVAFAPGGGNAADAIFTALTMAFMAAIVWTLYRFSVANRLTLLALPESRRAMLYIALGVIVLLIAGTSRMFSTGPGTVVWLLLLGGALLAIWHVWREALGR